MKLVILEDAEIVKMLRNPQIVEAFPFLRAAATAAAAPAKRGCGGCAKKKAQRIAGDYSGIRAAIGGLDETGMRKLKELMGLDVKNDKVRVYYKDVSRKDIKKTF